MAARSLQLGPGSALLVVDVQNDFLPGGRLPVAHGDRVIEPINHLIELFASRGLPIYASRDWHPPNHCSFTAQGGPWPPHCIAGSEGARFSEKLQLPPSVEIISKATDPAREAYSCFDGTDLARRLKDAGIRRIFLAGFATEYCVRFSSRDAVSAGFEVYVLEDAIGSISQEREEVESVKDEIRGIGARLVSVALLDDPGRSRAA